MPRTGANGESDDVEPVKGVDEVEFTKSPVDLLNPRVDESKLSPEVAGGRVGEASGEGGREAPIDFVGERVDLELSIFILLCAGVINSGENGPGVGA